MKTIVKIAPHRSIEVDTVIDHNEGTLSISCCKCNEPLYLWSNKSSLKRFSSKQLMLDALNAHFRHTSRV